MYRRVAHYLTIRTAIALTICIALLLLPGISLLISRAAQGQREERKAKPKPGKPEGVWPDLEDVKRESQIEPETPLPIPSTLRSKKTSGRAWDGRRVGDPPGLLDQNGTEPGGMESGLTSSGKRMRERRSARTRRAHASRRMMVAPPPMPENQFVQNFFSWALTVSPSADETTYWYDQLRVAYGQGTGSLKLAGVELGRTLFESAAYAARNRNAHEYVYDLYKTYLMRDPDPGGWAMWEGLEPTHGREYVRRGFEESGEFATLMANITVTGSATANAASLISARVDPRNQPGRGMLSRDTHWNLPLLSLPGRAGLDLGLTLSYSSLVWTRSGPYLYFDEDNGFPSAGFRLGFPTVQRKVFDAQTASNSYLLITGSGHRVALRQLGISNIYDAADSSYLRLTENGPGLWVHSTDGTKLSFSEVNGEYRCVEIKDRNGNYITVNYNPPGRLTTITDTLGRVITFNYDGNANLLSITQAWAGQPAHQWVGFGWGTRTMQSSFTSGAVVGTANGAILPLLTQVTLSDTSYFTFDYTNSLQISLLKNYFGTLERNATTFTYETPAGEAPRLLDTRLSARNWTGYNNVPSQVITQYSVAGDGACVLTAPDGTVYKEYYGTGWQKGLTTLSEVWSGGVRQKWTTSAWTQDNPSVSYEVNPRVTETNVYDAGGNRRRTTIDYGPYAQFGLPYAIREYAANGTTELRQTFTDYDLSQAYLERRIIGLVAYVHRSGTGLWQSKTSFTYDDPSRLQTVPAAATQHDTAYNTSLTARGNVTAVSRWDVTDLVNPARKLTTYTNYYNTGTPISTTDPAGHQSSLSYADSFSDNVNRNTFAYPTIISDADSNSSYVQYNFDFGATTRTQSPAPAGQTQGAIQTMTYNNLGQLERLTTANNGAYKRFWYGAEYTASYATVNNVADEAYSVALADGVGRTVCAVSSHPGSSGGYSLVHKVYNLMGRAWLQSNPTEIDAAWVPSGDDAAGAYYTQQTYDWQGRPLRTTHPDTTYREASYSGCGCAGGEVVTLTDEGTLDAGVAKRRQQKIYSDVLGRTVKTEILNWQNGPVYSATVNTYNARDQLTQVRQYAGPEGSGTYQDTTMTYDGYGRLKTKHVPEQNAGANTSWDYNADDTVQKVTDGRGTATTYAYNNRHLVTGITYSAPPASEISVPGAVSYTYDAASNRTGMTDGLGTVTYQYDQLSRLLGETRGFTGVGNYTIGYQYSLANDLSSITDPLNSTINYTRDNAGRLTAIARTGQTFASGITYRASGAMKYMLYGDNSAMNVSFNSKMQPATFSISGKISKTYTYNDDGTLRFSSDSIDHRFDRLYTFDHVGRLKTALSGAEARGEGTTTNRPYNQTYGYNAFGQLTQRTVKTWSTGDNAMSVSYMNNREQETNFQYDADGRVLIGNGEHLYDAAGRENFLETSGHGTVAMNFDGDGRQIKTVETSYDEQFNEITETKYYVRSTVLGGQVLAEMEQFNLVSRRFVYAGPTVLAWIWGSSSQGFESVVWDQRDPSGASVRAWGQQELDPLGADAGTHATSVPPTDGPLMSQGTSYNPANPGVTYSIDGIRVSANDFMNLAGMVLQDPLRLMEWFARRGGRPIGKRNTGVSWGRPFDVIYDANGKVSSVAWGKYNPKLQHLNYGKLSWIYGSEGIPDLSSLPENATFDLPGIAKVAEAILSDPKCIKFAETILNQLSGGKGGSLIDVFNAFFDQPKPHDLFTRVKPPGSRGEATTLGKLSNSTAAMFLVGGRPENQTASDADNVVQELFHFAGNGYSDEDLARALRKTTYAQDAKDAFPDGTANIFDKERYIPGKWSKQDGYSTYFHAIASRHCGFRSPNTYMNLRK